MSSKYLTISETDTKYLYLALISVSKCCYYQHWLHTLTKEFTLCKGNKDSFGYWIPRHSFRIPGTRFQILCQMNLDSGFQSLMGFWIPSALSQPSNLRGSNSMIFPDSRHSTSKYVPDSGIRIYMHGEKTFSSPGISRKNTPKKPSLTTVDLYCNPPQWGTGSRF